MKQRKLRRRLSTKEILDVSTTIRDCKIKFRTSHRMADWINERFGYDMVSDKQVEGLITDSGLKLQDFIDTDPLTDRRRVRYRELINKVGTVADRIAELEKRVQELENAATSPGESQLVDPADTYL